MTQPRTPSHAQGQKQAQAPDRLNIGGAHSLRTVERAKAFCAALAECCNVGKACIAIGMSRTSAYEWRDQDDVFRGMWDKAKTIGITAMEDEAHRRAFEGMNEPLVHQGQFTYLRDDSGQPLMNPDGSAMIATVKRYSDLLATFLLKAHDPKYRESTKVEMSGAVDLRSMSDDEVTQELAALELLEAARHPASPAPAAEDHYDDLL